MIAVATLKCAAMIGLTMAKGTQAHPRRRGPGHIAAGRSAGQRSRPSTRTSALRGICARVASIFAPGCLLPHVEPFNIRPSALVPPDVAADVLGPASPAVPVVPSALQRPTTAHWLVHVRAEQGCCAAMLA